MLPCVHNDGMEKQTEEKTITVVVEIGLLARIEAYQATISQNSKIEINRSQAIRSLIERGLEGAGL